MTRFLFRPSRKEGLASRAGPITDGWSPTSRASPPGLGSGLVRGSSPVTVARAVADFHGASRSLATEKNSFTKPRQDSNSAVSSSWSRWRPMKMRKLRQATEGSPSGRSRGERIQAEFDQFIGQGKNPLGGFHGGRPVEQPLVRAVSRNPANQKASFGATLVHVAGDVANARGENFHSNVSQSSGASGRPRSVRPERRPERSDTPASITRLVVRFLSIDNDFSLSVKLLFVIFPNIEKSDFTCNPPVSAPLRQCRLDAGSLSKRATGG
jgi:hypothetical protein